MPNGGKLTDWNKITTDEAYRLSQAEFKGMSIQALQDLQRDVQELKNYNNNTRYISMGIAGISGIVASIFGQKIT